MAYKLFHEAKNETPESLGMKGDHFVGQCYVEYDKYSKELKQNGPGEKEFNFIKDYYNNQDFPTYHQKND